MVLATFRTLWYPLADNFPESTYFFKRFWEAVSCGQYFLISGIFISEFTKILLASVGRLFLNLSLWISLVFFDLEMVMVPSSMGWRRDSSASLWNSGNSSKNKIPRWAKVISPGLGGFPPPMSSTSDKV